MKGFVRFRNYMSVLLVAGLFAGCGGGGSVKDSTGFGSNHTVDEHGDSWELDNGATINIPAAAVTSTTKVNFKKTAKPKSLGDEATTYIYATDNAVKSAVFTLPVEFNDINSKDDLAVLYVNQKNGAYNILDFVYNSSENNITFKVEDNHTFNQPPILIKDSSKNNFLRKDASVFDALDTFIYILNPSAYDFITGNINSKKAIPMPFYTQMDQTCWATSGQMLSKSLYPAGTGPNHQIYDFMNELNIPIDEGLGEKQYKPFIDFLSDSAGEGEESSFYTIKGAKKKILELLNKDIPVLFAREGHQVLIVGYKNLYTESFLTLIQHDPQDPYKGVYSELAFMDSFGFKSKLTGLSAIKLAWVNLKPNPLRALQTVGIPSYNLDVKGGSTSNYDFKFTGKRTVGVSNEELKNIYIGFWFDETKENGYRWGKIGGLGDYNGGTFPRNIDTFSLDLPVWNTDREKTADLKIEVRFIAKNQSLPDVFQKREIKLKPNHSIKTLKFKFDLKKYITSKLTKETAFTLRIKLSLVSGKVLSETNIEGIVLQPVNDVTVDNIVYEACPIKYDKSKGYGHQTHPRNRNLFVHSIPHKVGAYKLCMYKISENPDRNNKLWKIYPFIDKKINGLAYVYSTINGSTISSTMYKDGKKHGNDEHYKTDGSLLYCNTYQNGVIVGSCM